MEICSTLLHVHSVEKRESNAEISKIKTIHISQWMIRAYMKTNFQRRLYLYIQMIPLKCKRSKFPKEEKLVESHRAILDTFSPFAQIHFLGLITLWKNAFNHFFTIRLFQIPSLVLFLSLSLLSTVWHFFTKLPAHFTKLSHFKLY